MPRPEDLRDSLRALLDRGAAARRELAACREHHERAIVKARQQRDDARAARDCLLNAVAAHMRGRYGDPPEGPWYATDADLYRAAGLRGPRRAQPGERT